MNKKLEEQVGDLLTKFGIHPHLKGFRYIISAVVNYDGNMKTMDIYKLISEEFNTTPISVERSIRNAFGHIDLKDQFVADFFGKKFTSVGYISIISWKLKKGEI